ncbi:MAG: hypothetical protein WCW52_05890, partial [Elusimicrobiales bacterium]
MNIKRILPIALALACAADFQAAAQSTPSLISFQGRLTDALNNPLAGSYNFDFAVYAAQTGGVPLWSETQNGVTVANGVLAAELGSNTPIPYSVFSSAQRYLEITVNGTTLSPRQRLLSVPYAANAQTINGRDYDAIVSTDSAQTIGGVKTFTANIFLNQVSVSSDIYLSAGRINLHGNLVTTADGLLDASKLANTVPNSALDESSVTKRGNNFNGANQLVLLNASGKLPALDGSALTNINAGSVGAADVQPGTFSAGVILPAGQVAAGALGANVVVSSIAAGAVRDSAVISISAAKLTGSLPAIDGSALTGITASAIAAGNITAGLLGPTVIASSVAAASIYPGSVKNGAYGIDITGNAATVTNGVYTGNFYANPSWITSLSTSKIDLSTVTAALANAANWDAAYSWGNHANAGYLTTAALNDIRTSTGAIQTSLNNVITSTGAIQAEIDTLIASTGPLANYPAWNTAAAWGNHADAGYASSTALNAVASSTGAINSDLQNYKTAVQLSTAGLAAALDNIITSTGLIQTALDGKAGTGANTFTGTLTMNAATAFTTTNQPYLNISTNVVLSGSQLKFGNFSVAPPAGEIGKGAVYYNTANDSLYVSNGAGWIQLAAGGTSPWGEGAGAVTLNTNSNKVGIGKAPAEKLDVAGSIKADYAVIAATAVFSDTGANALVVAGGIKAGNVNIIGADGRIPALNTTYLANLDGSALTGITAAQVGALTAETDPLFAASAAFGITASSSSAWNLTASSAAYWNAALRTETDALFAASAAFGITASSSTAWNLTASSAAYWNAALRTETDALFAASAAFGITASSSTAWNLTASSAAYWNAAIRTETDPLFTAHISSNITVSSMTNWNNAFAWGNHANAGYLTGYTETDPTFTASTAFGITASSSTAWNLTASSAAYWNAALRTETDPLFTASTAFGITDSSSSAWNLTASSATYWNAALRTETD